MRRFASRRASGFRWTKVLFLTAFLAAGCSGDKATEPDSAIAPFVGDWTALSFVLTSQANPDISGDLIAFGATFTLNVQPSGQYTAILLYAGQSATTIGTMEVSGNTVTLHQTIPSASTSAGTFAFEGGHLILDFNTEFDFNGDGTPEAAVGHADFVRKQ